MIESEIFGILVMGWMCVGITLSCVFHKIRDIFKKEIAAFIRDW